MKRNILKLGKKLMVACPDNDCIIYLNTYKMYCDVTKDLNGYPLSEHGKMVLSFEKERLFLELKKMYFTNYAVRQYQKEHK